MEIKTAEIVHTYPTEVWFEKDLFGTVHIKMQHMAPGVEPFTFISINYDYAYTSNSNQYYLVSEIAKVLGVDSIQERAWKPNLQWKEDMEDAASMDHAECYCYTCNKDKKDKFGFPRVMTRMIVCPECGNKRCPHATDHNMGCTNSNEPGQYGSRY